MPTTETATKAGTQVAGGGDVDTIISYQLVSPESQPTPVASGQSLLRKVTVEPANLEGGNLSTDFTGQLSDLAALESIQAELDRLQNSTGDGDAVTTSTVQLSTQPAQLTMATGDTSSLLGTLDSGSAIANQSGTVLSMLQNDHSLQESVMQQGPTIQVKRPRTAASNSGQMVTKVIITKNPTTNQTQQVAIPVSSSHHSGQIVVVGSQGLTPISTAQGLMSPTKTITIGQGGIVSPTKYITSPATPTKLIPANKVALSPVKTPTKITMIPTSTKSPQRVISATGQVLTMVAKTVSYSTSGTTTVTSSATKPTTITMSPSRVIIKHQTVGNQSGSKMALVQQLNTGPKMQGIPLSNVQPLSVSGSKFQYVRLVTTPAAQSQTTLATAKPASIAPMTLQAKPVMTTANTQMKIAMPSNSATQMVGRPTLQTLQQTSQQSQRILLPATGQVALRPSSANSLQTLTQIRPAGSGGALTQLPPGTTIISGGQNIQGVQSFALVPAQYVTQVGTIGQQLSQPQGAAPLQDNSGYVPIASSSTTEVASARQNMNGAVLQEPSGQRPRKPCNCTKSQCLKLYCDCFANGEFCHNCNCTNCANNLDHEEERSRAIKACLDRNPLAFHPKIGKGRGERRHNKGCNCKRSGCLKNYCECYEAKILCTSTCKCVGCKNFEESPDRKTLMHLADAAEVRVQQQTSAKAKLSSQIQDLPSRPPAPVTGERFPYTFVTKEVAEATCACLIAQAEEAERTRQMEMVQERMILEEFGRCLMQVIESAGRTKAPSPLP